MPLRVFLFLQSFGRVEKMRHKFFVCLVEFSGKAIQYWILFAKKKIFYRFYFHSSDQSVQIIYFFIQFWQAKMSYPKTVLQRNFTQNAYRAVSDPLSMLNTTERRLFSLRKILV